MRNREKIPGLMWKIGMRLAAGILISLLATACSHGCTILPAEIPEHLTIMSWNVENLFNGIREGTEYPEFDPEGGSWDAARYHVRLEAAARVLLEMAEPRPDIICFQEIEHIGVLRDLIGSYLSKAGYTFAAATAAEFSAIQVGVVSRFPITDFRTHAVSGETSFSHRPMLEAEILIGRERIAVFASHWKSRIGGAEATEAARIEAAEAVWQILLRREARNPDQLIIFAGDLNVSADEPLRIGWSYPTSLVPVELADIDLPHCNKLPCTKPYPGLPITGVPDLVRPGILFNPWLEQDPAARFPGSYVYRGQWYSYDHIMCGTAGFDGSGWDYAGFSVLGHDELLDSSGFPRGWDMRTGRGYSDHLPILLHFKQAE